MSHIEEKQSKRIVVLKRTMGLNDCRNDSFSPKYSTQQSTPPTPQPTPTQPSTSTVSQQTDAPISVSVCQQAMENLSLTTSQASRPQQGPMTLANHVQQRTQQSQHRTDIRGQQHHQQYNHRQHHQQHNHQQCNHQQLNHEQHNHEQHNHQQHNHQQHNNQHHQQCCHHQHSHQQHNNQHHQQCCHHQHNHQQHNHQHYNHQQHNHQQHNHQQHNHQHHQLQQQLQLHVLQQLQAERTEAGTSGYHPSAAGQLTTTSMQHHHHQGNSVIGQGNSMNISQMAAAEPCPTFSQAPVIGAYVSMPLTTVVTTSVLQCHITSPHPIRQSGTSQHSGSHHSGVICVVSRMTNFHIRATGAAAESAVPSPHLISGASPGNHNQFNLAAHHPVLNGNTVAQQFPAAVALNSEHVTNTRFINQSQIPVQTSAMHPPQAQYQDPSI